MTEVQPVDDVAKQEVVKGLTMANVNGIRDTMMSKAAVVEFPLTSVRRRMSVMTATTTVGIAIVTQTTDTGIERNSAQVSSEMSLEINGDETLENLWNTINLLLAHLLAWLMIWRATARKTGAAVLQLLRKTTDRKPK